MNMVKRLSIIGWACELGDDNTPGENKWFRGVVYRDSDYAAIEAKCRELEAELRERRVSTTQRLLAEWEGTKTQRITELESALEGAASLRESDLDGPDLYVHQWRELLVPSKAAAVEPCRIHEYDGAFKCMTHQKTWGAITNGGAPCEGFDEKRFYAERDESRRMIPASAAETPEATRARIVTETADAIAKDRGLTAETLDVKGTAYEPGCTCVPSWKQHEPICALNRRVK